MFRAIAWCYAAVVGAATIWAWAVDIALFNDDRDHLLPDIVLAIVTMPSSLALNALYDVSEPFFNLPFTQLAFLTLCGAAQVAIALFVARTIDKRLNDPLHPRQKIYGAVGFVAGAVTVGALLKDAVLNGEMSPPVALQLALVGGAIVSIVSSQWWRLRAAVTKWLH